MPVMTPGVIPTGTPPGRSSNLADFIALPLPRYAFELSAAPVQLLVGAGTPTPPVMNEPTTPGVFSPTVMDDWYYRIHINPKSFDLGNLAGDQQRPLTLWNAFLVPVNVTFADLIDGEGMSFTQSVALPGTLAALELVDYSFFISANGPPVVEAVMRWVIDGVTYEVEFAGRRAVMMGFAPNWSTSYRVTYEWLTVVGKSFSGKEQRSQPRRGARCYHEYQIRIHDDDAKLFDLLTFGWQARMFVHPMWNQRTSLSSAAAIGATAITVDDASYRNFMPGQSLVLWAGATAFEMGEIASVVGDVITFVGTLQQAWPAGTRVYPAATSKLTQSLSTTRAVPSHVDTLVRFLLSPTDNVLRLPEVAAPVTYLGEELYTKKTNWRSGLPIAINASEIVSDVQTGPFRLTRRAQVPEVSRGFSWMAKNRTQSEELLQFFVRRRGRLKPVWMPSGTEDMILDEDATDAQAFIYVKRTQYATLIDGNPSRRHLVIMLRDGTRIAREITDFVDSGDRSLVSLNTGLGHALTPANVKRISFLGLYRLGADSITFNFHTADVCEVEASLVLTEPYA